MSQIGSRWDAPELAHMIHVIAIIELNEGRREAFLAEFHRVLPHVRAESGCIEYGPAIDIATEIAAQHPLRDHVVTIIEKWETLEHLNAHLAAPHMKEYRARARDMITHTTLHILTPA
jgi:quinol monooxygenase YgiN